MIFEKFKFYFYKFKIYKNKISHKQNLKNFYLCNPPLKTSEKVLIIGNAPSIVDLDFDRFRDYDLFVCNGFDKHSQFKTVSEKFNLVYFVGDRMQTFLDYAKKYFNSVEEAICEYFQHKLSTKYSLCCHVSFGEILQKEFGEKRVSFWEIEDLKERIMMINQVLKLKISEEIINEAVNIRHTPNLMMLMGLALRYREIGLVGLEHSYVRDRFAGIFEQTHFYNNSVDFEKEEYDMQHRDLTELFLDSHLTFKLYRSQAELGRLLGVKIIDYTENGCLDMFEKGGL